LVTEDFLERLDRIERVLARILLRVDALEVQVDAERTCRESSERTMAKIDRHAAELKRVEAELAMLAAPPAGLRRQ
jgi:hypothetical protein